MAEYETFEASDGELSIRRAHTFQEDCWCNGPPITHEDDSYGDCTTCREWVHHTEEDYRHVAYPCPTVRLGEVEAALERERREHLTDVDTLSESLIKADNRRDELQATFDLRWKADMRAIAMWQKKTRRSEIWPDHADLVVWLLEHLDSVMAVHKMDTDHLREQHRKVSEALGAMLLAGQHEGDCDNGDGREDACTLHVAASAERMRRAQDALL